MKSAVEDTILSSDWLFRLYSLLAGTRSSAPARMSDHERDGDRPGKKLKLDDAAAVAPSTSSMALSQIFNAHSHNEELSNREMEEKEKELEKNSLERLYGEDLDEDEEDDEFSDNDANLDHNHTSSDEEDMGFESDSSIEGPAKQIMKYVLVQRAKGVKPATILSRFGYSVQNVCDTLTASAFSSDGRQTKCQKIDFGRSRWSF